MLRSSKAFNHFAEAPRAASFSVDVESPFSGAEDGAFSYLELFAKIGVRATFFVVGELAERRPDLVDEILKSGHEVASHGWNHPNIGEPVYDRAPFLDQMDSRDLEIEMQRCVEVLTRNEEPPHGFRAPWFRANKRTLEVVRNYFSYDSSLTIRNYPKQLPNGLRELPVSTLTTRGPKLGTSFLFGPGIVPTAKQWLGLFPQNIPLVLFGHSFDLQDCPRNLQTARWKKIWYFNRCGQHQQQNLSDLITFLMEVCGYSFSPCNELPMIGADETSKSNRVQYENN